MKWNAPAWNTPVAPGLSAPVLAGNRIFLTAVKDGRLFTCAYDTQTGDLLWEKAAPEVPLEKVHAVASPAASTPLANDKRVCVYFGSFGLLCYDHGGAELWRKPVPTPKSLYGMATSLIPHGENVILVLDNDADLPGSKLSASKVIAINRTTGETAWETARPFVRSGWSTPALWRHDGGEELVVLGSGRLTGYDPASGAEKWFTTGFSRETIAQPAPGAELLYASASMLGGVADEQPDPGPFWKAMLHFDTDGDSRIARSEITRHFTFPLRPELPVEHPGFGIPLRADAEQRAEQQRGTFAQMDKDKDGYIAEDEFLSALSFQRGKPMLVAIRPGGSGDISGTHVAWQLNRSIPEIPSPLLHKNRLYLIRNGGLLSCVNAEDGKVIYTQRVNAGGQYSASPVVANDHIYLVSNGGVVSVVKAGDAFELVHEHDLGEPAFVTPAFDATTIYIRTQSSLRAFSSADPPRGPKPAL